MDSNQHGPNRLSPYLPMMRCSPRTMALWIPQKQGASPSWIASKRTVSIRLVTGQLPSGPQSGHKPENLGQTNLIRAPCGISRDDYRARISGAERPLDRAEAGKTWNECTTCWRRVWMSFFAATREWNATSREMLSGFHLSQN
jgi:hypothetical protein